MPGLGIGVADSFRGSKRAPRVASPITATVQPASSPLIVGQRLSETQNWATFTDLANYATSTAGEIIASVVVNYIGGTGDATEPFADGQTNSFSVTVTDTAGALRTFSVIPRSVVHLAPLFDGPLVDQSFFIGTGLQSYDVSGLFTGEDLSFAIISIPGVSIDTTTGIISFETDLLPLVSGASAVVTAYNSGGSVFGSFSFDLRPPTVLTAEIAGLENSVSQGDYAQIGMTLTGQISGLLGDEIILHRWQDSGGVIAGADSPSYTPMSDQDLETLRYVPLVNGDALASPAYTVRHAAPIAGTLAPVSSTLGSGTPMVNLTAGFIGAGLSFSEYAPWAQINGTVLTIDDAVRDDIVTITATSSGGQANVDLRVNITAAPVTVPAQMAAPLIVAIGSSDVTVTLAADPEDGGAPITARGIRYSLDGTTWTFAGGITNPYVLSGLTAETEYLIQARVSNAVGVGPWSPTVTVTTDARPPVAGPVFSATRTGSDLTLDNVPDVAAQSFTVTPDGTNLIVTFTGALETPAPQQLGILAAENHDGTRPETGTYTLEVLDLGTPVDNVYTVPVSTFPSEGMVILLSPDADVVGGGQSEFKRVVFVGASILGQSFGTGDLQRVPEVEALFSERGAAIEAYVHAVSGSDAGQIQTLLNEAMVAFPQDTLFFVHAGGNDVTDARPYPGAAAALTASLEGLADIAASRPGTVILSDLTFRDYDGTTVQDEAAGSKPYNDTLYLPLFQARKADLLERAYYDDGTPVSCLYEWSYANRATYLSADTIHPADPEGRALLRNWLVERLTPLCLGQPAPAQEDRISLAPVTQSVDLFVEYGINTASGVNTPTLALATENAGQVSEGPFGLYNRDGSNPGVTLNLEFSAPAPGNASGFGLNLQGKSVPVTGFDGNLYSGVFTTDSYFVGSAYTVDHVISGLTPDTDYRVGLVASRNAGGPRETRYSFAQGEIALIETTTDPVSQPVFVDTRSDATGTITITQSAASGAWSYLGGLHISDI